MYPYVHALIIDYFVINGLTIRGLCLYGIVIINRDT